MTGLRGAGGFADPLPSAFTEGSKAARAWASQVLALLRRGGSVLAVLGVLLNSLHGDGVGACATKFCCFFKGYLEVATHALRLGSRTRPGRNLWPMGLPFPAAEAYVDPQIASRRRMQRWRRTQQLRRLVNGIVVTYSYLACGCPVGGAGLEFAAADLTAAQWELVNRIEDRARELCRAGALVELAGGRADVLNELMTAVDGGAVYGGTMVGTALMVKSEEVPLPTQAGIVNLQDVVPEVVARCLQTPGAFDAAVEDLPDTRPGCAMQIEYDEWIKLLKRMIDNKMVTLVRADGLPHWRGKPVTAGLFGVPKSAQKMRFIVDRRWQNSLEVDLMTALRRLGAAPDELAGVQQLIRLPHGGMWSELLLAPDDEISINVDDLQDYYYLLRWPDNLER
ncbi:MAG: hypothetical protein FJ284_15730, partial [Planctomycetes bacterium]|nr:hypothetical protein [Planctomycetota bacterium]